jgi:uncharacterized protein YcgI (DUF1989 family)
LSLTWGGESSLTVSGGDASRVFVVAAQSGVAVRADRGELIVVTDVEGHQVGDLWAIDAVDHGRWLSCGHTRDRIERLFPAVGEDFRDQFGDPILRLAGDTSPGVHDMLFPACDLAMYAAQGLIGHANCRDNFLAAVASAGVELPGVPDPVNVFQNSGPHADGRLVIGPAQSEPGDEISFLALRAVVVVVTSCAVDYPPLNDGRCTALRVTISRAGGRTPGT